jgi:hypothetical protein
MQSVGGTRASLPGGHAVQHAPDYPFSSPSPLRGGDRGGVAKRPEPTMQKGARSRTPLKVVGETRPYSALTVTVFASSHATALRSGRPNWLSSISNTSPGSVLMPSAKLSVAVPNIWT